MLIDWFQLISRLPLGTWLATIVEYYYIVWQGRNVTATSQGVIVTSLVLPLITNAVVTGLIVFRIFKVYRYTKPILYNQGATFRIRSKFRPIMLMLIESGMLLFSIQLVRLIVGVVPTTAANLVYQPVSIMQQMFYVIIMSLCFFIFY